MSYKPRVLVVGPVCNISGYSEHARTLLDALLNLEDEIDIYLQDTQWAVSTRSMKYAKKYSNLIEKTNQLFNSRRDSEGKINIAGLFECTYQVRPPNEFQKLSENDIGVTAALETTFAPPEWVPKCNQMDHILVVSEHAKKNLRNTKDNNGMGISTPITVIPFGFDSTVEKVNVYRDLNITTKFNFLSIFQLAPRKNFENMLKWFVEEFKDDEDVGLVVKVHEKNNSTLDFHACRVRISKLLNTFAPERKCKVHLVHGNLSEQEMASLYDTDYIDCYISTTHGEGFGIPMFNAACNGIPVIATNWSGHLDFLRAPVKNRTGRSKIRSHFLKTSFDINKVQPHHIMPGLINQECEWAYPKEDSFKKNMRLVVSNSKAFQEDANNLSVYLKSKFDAQEISRKYQDFLRNDLSLEQVENVSVEELPKISIITSIYNGDNYIREFLEDITNQTIFEDKCELILINANSPGSEESVIKEYLEKYPNNIVYKKLEQDPGIYGVWNIGVEMSTGQFLTNANLDDRKRTDSLEVHAKELFSNPDVDLVYANSFCTRVPNETFNDSKKDWDLLKAPAYNGKDTMIKGNPPHQNPMWRKTLHEKHGMFNDEYFSAGDWEMWLRASFGGSKFKHINKTLGLYYFNPEGISTNKETESKKQKEEMSIFMKYNKLLNTES
tara:strand:- start:783 stop:2783 length:2001 start_codon:yes stop_codon:yes gene_type:complete